MSGSRANVRVEQADKVDGRVAIIQTQRAPQSDYACIFPDFRRDLAGHGTFEHRDRSHGSALVPPKRLLCPGIAQACAAGEVLVFAC